MSFRIEEKIFIIPENKFLFFKWLKKENKALKARIDDLEKMLIEFEKGTDMVIGWRKNRKDSFISKTLPSIIANFFVRVFSAKISHQ